YLHGHPYALQLEWSNAAGGCAQFFPSLRFSTQPGSGAPGQPLGPQPVVQATSLAGVVQSSVTGSVTLTLKSGTGPAGASLSSGIVAPLSGGVATFSGL